MVDLVNGRDGGEGQVGREFFGWHFWNGCWLRWMAGLNIEAKWITNIKKNKSCTRNSCFWARDPSQVTPAAWLVSSGDHGDEDWHVTHTQSHTDTAGLVWFEKENEPRESCSAADHARHVQPQPKKKKREIEFGEGIRGKLSRINQRRLPNPNPSQEISRLIIN
jgi:hypothetical protein